jgi:two-component system chemotaxis response regulator CheY
MKSDVLVVDDSAAIQKLLQRVLRQTKLSIGVIHEARDGQEALTLLAAHRVDLILLDVNMPNMDGFELLALLKASAQLCHIPVVVITVEGGQTEISKGIRLGAVGYVRKPIVTDQFIEMLAGIVNPELPPTPPSSPGL